MKVVCKACKKQVDTDKYDFCPQCGANLKEAEEVPEKAEKESKPLFFLNKEADDALKRELKANGLQLLIVLVILLIFWLFKLF